METQKQQHMSSPKSNEIRIEKNFNKPTNHQKNSHSDST